MDRVSSYDRDALLPKVGTRWVWEVDSELARELVEVVETLWNGEEWFVRTRTLLPRRNPLAKFPGEPERTLLNDVGRFWEACLPVLPKLTGRMDQFSERRATRRTGDKE